jgi:Replication-relaxation
VALSTGLPEGVRLAEFEREAEARETFRGYDGKEHAVAPDAYIQIAGSDDRHLLGLVELDLGTMSTRQLKAKAEGYGDYVQLEGWRQRNEFCPPLLFITTSEKRARSFLAICEKAIGRRRMLVAATGLARDIGCALTAPEWLVEVGGQSADLLAILRAARRPYDEAREQEKAQRREEDEERNQLRSNPEALAARLHDELRRGWGRDRLDQITTSALLLSAEGESELGGIERTAFDAVAGMLDEPLYLRLEDRELTHSERAALDALVTQHRRTQLRLFGELAARFGEGPALRSRRRQFEEDGLLRRDCLESLSRDAERDQDARADQDRLRDEYLSWREQEAKRLAKGHGLIERHRLGRDVFLRQVTKDALRRCGSCEEIAYPDPEQASSRAKRHVAERCHYCGGRVTREINPDEEPA